MASQRRHVGGTHHFIRHEERRVWPLCSIESDGIEEVSVLFARGIASSFERVSFHEYYERDGRDTEYDETIHEEGIVGHGNYFRTIIILIQKYSERKICKIHTIFRIIRNTRTKKRYLLFSSIF